MRPGYRWFIVCLFWTITTCLALGAQPQNFYDTSRLNLEVEHGTLLRYERSALPPFYRAKAWRILDAARDEE